MTTRPADDTVFISLNPPYRLEAQEGAFTFQGWAEVDDPNAPRHLGLGADAYDVLDRTMAARMADIARYRELGEKTGFEGAEVRTIGA